MLLPSLTLKHIYKREPMPPCAIVQCAWYLRRVLKPKQREQTVMGKQSKCAAIVLRGKIYSRSDQYQGKYSPLSALCHPQVTH